MISIKKYKDCMKNTRDTTALIKDLELQIDRLVGYTPMGGHWKQEWWMRERMVSETLACEDTPEEVRDKINRIQQKLHELRNGITNEKPYLDTQHEIIVKCGGKKISSFSLPDRATFPTIGSCTEQYTMVQ